MTGPTKDSDLIAREGFFILLISAAVAISAFLWSAWAGAVATAWYFFCLYFFRNPMRLSHEHDDVMLCPADGKVVFVGKAMEPDFLKEERLRVTIFMSPFNVHVNRVPLTGTVQNQVHHKGKFAAAFRESASLENERSVVHLKTASGLDVVFVQIAGWFARRIVCYAKLGEKYERGQIFGVIKFGSRMDIYLPPAYKPAIEIGNKVFAGKTVLAKL